MTLKILIGRFSRNFFSRTTEGIELKSGIYVPMNVFNMCCYCWRWQNFQIKFTIPTDQLSGGGSQSTRTTTDHREASGKLDHYRVYGIKYKIFHEQVSVLGVARMFREELVVMPHDEDYNTSNRYAAYRQYTIGAHGRLARVPGQPQTIGKQVVNLIIIGYMG
jgi:hypothetical protein